MGLFRKKKKVQEERVVGEESDMAEKLLAILMFPFMLAWKILFKVFKMLVKSIVLAPFTILIYIGIIVVVVILVL